MAPYVFILKTFLTEYICSHDNIIHNDISPKKKKEKKIILLFLIHIKNFSTTYK